jgi:hypothetical protein
MYEDKNSTNQRTTIYEKYGQDKGYGVIFGATKVENAKSNQ